MPRNHFATTDSDNDGYAAFMNQKHDRSNRRRYRDRDRAKSDRRDSRYED